MSRATVPCRSCKAPIIWVHHQRTQRIAPIDASPSAEGNCLFIDDATYVVLGERKRAECTEPLHTNHFMTCPDAKRWKR